MYPFVGTTDVGTGTAAAAAAAAAVAAAAVYHLDSLGRTLVPVHPLCSQDLVYFLATRDLVAEWPLA